MIYILLTVYLLSAFGSWWYTSKAYFHPRSKFRFVEPDIIDWLFVLTPLLNTFHMFTMTFDWEDEKDFDQIREEITTKLWKTKW